MSKFNRAQPVTDDDDLIVETMPPAVAQPVTLRWRSSNSGHTVKAQLESMYHAKRTFEEHCYTSQQSDGE